MNNYKVHGVKELLSKEGLTPDEMAAYIINIEQNGKEEYTRFSEAEIQIEFLLRANGLHPGKQKEEKRIELLKEYGYRKDIEFWEKAMKNYNPASDMPCKGEYCTYCNSRHKDEGCPGEVNLVCNKKSCCRKLRKALAEYTFGDLEKMDNTGLFGGGRIGYRPESLDELTSEFFRDTCRESDKIKVSEEPIIVVRDTLTGKPYYGIKYKKAGEDNYTIGYSSYYFEYVEKWKEECFEVVKK